MPREIICSKCNNKMIEGIIPDYAHSSVMQNTWVAGSPEKQTFFGMKTGSLKFKPQEALKIKAFRCGSCGFLELYALEDN